MSLPREKDSTIGKSFTYVYEHQRTDHLSNQNPAEAKIFLIYNFRSQFPSTQSPTQHPSIPPSTISLTPFQSVNIPSSTLGGAGNCVSSGNNLYQYEYDDRTRFDASPIKSYMHCNLRRLIIPVPGCVGMMTGSSVEKRLSWSFTWVG